MVWMKNPWSGTLTYFNEIHKKQYGYSVERGASNSRPQLSQEEFHKQMTEAKKACIFCPGNEEKTTSEILKVTYGEIFDDAEIPHGLTKDDWVFRAFHNILPRIPEISTGGKNESYVVIEDPRHYQDGAKSHDDLLFTGALNVKQTYHLIKTNIEIVKMAYSNSSVKSVLIRKNQGLSSGASQPHIHNQVMGADHYFPDILQEMHVTELDPQIWQECIDCFREERWVVEDEGDIVTYRSPFGKFPMSFDLVYLSAWGMLHDLDDERLRRFTDAFHRLLNDLGPIALDYEIHHGIGIPIHLHINSRQLTYANIGGTINVPFDMNERLLLRRRTGGE